MIESRSTTSAAATSGPEHIAARGAYWRWNLFLLGLLVLTTASFGSGLDRLDPLPAGALFAALTLSSLLGVALAGIVVFPWFVGGWERLLLLVLLYVAWRLTYFPLVQLAILASGLAADGMLAWTPMEPWIYPTVLVLFSTLNAVAASLALWPLATRRARWAAIAWPPLALAGLISFCGWEDAHPLPDRGYQGDALAPLEKTAGRWSPDGSGAANSGETPVSPQPWATAQRRWLTARLRRGLAAFCYRLRGAAPWSDVVQTRIHEELALPPRRAASRGSGSRGSDSTAEHLRICYAACIAAQDLVGQRRLVVYHDAGDAGR